MMYVAGFFLVLIGNVYLSTKLCLAMQPVKFYGMPLKESEYRRPSRKLSLRKKNFHSFQSLREE